MGRRARRLWPSAAHRPEWDRPRAHETRRCKSDFPAGRVSAAANACPHQLGDRRLWLFRVRVAGGGAATRARARPTPADERQSLPCGVLDPRGRLRAPVRPRFAVGGSGLNLSSCGGGTLQHRYDGLRRPRQQKLCGHAGRKKPSLAKYVYLVRPQPGPEEPIRPPRSGLCRANGRAIAWFSFQHPGQNRSRRVVLPG